MTAVLTEKDGSKLPLYPIFVNLRTRAQVVVRRPHRVRIGA